MARVHKVEFYLVDWDDFYDTGEDLIDQIKDDLEYGFIQCSTWKTSEEFEWDDELDINRIDCTKDKCERYVSTDKEMEENLGGVDKGYLYDWYIYSVFPSDAEPVWTEEHIEELYNDFIVIPRKVRLNEL